MATSQVSIPKNVWTLVSSVSVSFQIPEQSSAYAIESVALPIDLSIRKKIQPGKIYTFTKLDGDLYIYSPDVNNSVAIDPIS